MNYILEILRGALIGVANVIPGVSGGTMMVSMGIYDKIIGSITHITKQFKKSVLTLLPYFIGMGIGIIVSSFSIELMFEKFPVPTALLFIGLIFGGIPMLAVNLKEKKTNVWHIVLFICAFALVVGLQLLGNRTGVEKTLELSAGNFVVAFFVGTIASATMVIPGVSGSMVMMILGYYTAVLGLINDCITALVSLDFGVLFGCIGILIPFGIGVIFGIVAVAHLIEYLMKYYKKETYCAILGLVTASPVPVFMNAGIESVSILMVLAGIVTFGLGFYGALRLGKE